MPDETAAFRGMRVTPPLWKQGGLYPLLSVGLTAFRDLVAESVVVSEGLRMRRDRIWSMNMVVTASSTTCDARTFPWRE